MGATGGWGGVGVARGESGNGREGNCMREQLSKAASRGPCQGGKLKGGENLSAEARLEGFKL